MSGVAPACKDATAGSVAPTLLLGTGNRGKVAELQALFAGCGWRLVSLDQLAATQAPAPEVEETGSTLAENAALKATAYARHFGLWTLADDTALEVAALGGAPGLFTARYAGPHATAADNRRRLLSELAGVPDERRAARFVCHLTLASPTGEIVATSQGHCQGRIRLNESGSGGFGYDPLFEIVEYRRTFAELGAAAKDVLSHRARAAAGMVESLVGLDHDVRQLGGNRI